MPKRGDTIRWRSPSYDIGRMDFSAGTMGTGKGLEWNDHDGIFVEEYVCHDGEAMMRVKNTEYDNIEFGVPIKYLVTE